jgi:O-antigen/teichoic acid export membrane protein
VTLLRDTVKLYGGNLFLIPAGILLTVVSARMLGPEVRGLLTAAFIVPNFVVQFATMGMPAAGTYFIERKGIDPRTVGSTLMWSGFAIGLLLALVMLVVFAFVPGVRHGSIGMREQALALLVLPMSLPSSFFSNLYIARRWHGRRVLNGLASPLVRIGVILLVAGVLAPPGEGDYQTFFTLVAVMWVGSALVTFVSAWFMRDWVMGRPSWPLARQLAGFGGWSMVATGSVFLLNFADQYLLPKLRPEDGMVLLGIYTVAYAVFLQAMGVARSFTQTYFHRSLETPLEQVDREIATLARRGAQGALLLGAAIALAAPVLVVVLGGEEFAGAALPLQVLALSAPAYVASEILSNAAFTRGRTRLSALPAVTGLAINIALNIILIPELGMMACAWATVAGFWAMAIHRWLIFWRLAGRRQAAQVFAVRGSDAAFFANVVRRAVRGVAGLFRRR